MNFHETSMAFSEHMFLLFIQFLWSDNFIRIIPQQVFYYNKKLEEILTHLFASTFGHEPVSSTDNIIQKLEKFQNDQLVQLSLSSRKTFDCIPLATNSKCMLHWAKHASNPTCLQMNAIIVCLLKALIL